MQRKSCSINLALFLPVLAAVLLAVSAPAFGAARIVLVNKDNPGVGFNDPTPAAPVGGNRGATVGEQRRIAVQYALDIWAAELDSKVEIRAQARFTPLPCSASDMLLGSAGAIQTVRNFPGAEFPHTWYPIALANKQAGHDLVPEQDDITINLNSSLGGANPDGSPCLSGASWYYGLDANQSEEQFNLVTVILHELAHGLGFIIQVDQETGAKFHGSDDIYTKFIFDATAGKRWEQMTDAERLASMGNTRRVVWDGPSVKAAVPRVLKPGMPRLKVNTPGGIQGDYVAYGADFNPPSAAALVTGNIVLAADGEGVATDACSPLQNAQAVRGAIALVDRGTCAFTEKVKNAQAAGAIGVLVANHRADSQPFGMSGNDPAIAIRSVLISLADGNRIKAALGSQAVNVTLGDDPAIFAGADLAGRALLYTPNLVNGSSSIVHWDSAAFPDQIMEPFNSPHLRSIKEPEDLSMALMKDLGWAPRDGGGSVASVSAASFRDDALASDEIVAAFGARLATTVMTAPGRPGCPNCLSTELAGTRVKVKDSRGVEQLAPLFFVSPGQVNYLMPAGTAAGAATVAVTSGDGTVSTGTVQIASVAPGLFTANSDGQGVPAGLALRVRGNAQGFEEIAQYDDAQRRFAPRPLDLGPATDRVFLILFGTGLRHHQGLSSVSARIGGMAAPVLFASRQGDLSGLDQVNLELPRNLSGRGEVDVVLSVDGKPANTVRVSIR